MTDKPQSDTAVSLITDGAPEPKDNSYRRIRLLVEYDGRGFSGWQRQKGVLSVQEVLEQALVKTLSRHLVQEPRLQVAGRTDAGVHALGQVAHIDLPLGVEITAQNLLTALNYHVRPHRICVLQTEEMSGDWHARFSAKSRHYRYHILNRPPPPALRAGFVWHVPHPLDLDAMQDAAQHLVGTHDFTTFRHSHCQAQSPIKTLDYFTFKKTGDEIIAETGARSFLHHQVRSMIGCLKLVGSGKWQPLDIKNALQAKNRDALGFNAPPGGLYFVRVDYQHTDAASET